MATATRTASATTARKARTSKTATASAALAAATSATSATATTSGPPDYANLPTSELLSAFWGVVRSPLFDGAAALVNSQGGVVAGMVTGALAGVVSACIGLRKAYGRGISADAVATDLGIVAPSGFNPTFGLYLQAARLKADDAADRKTATEIKGAVRRKIKAERSAK